MNGHRLTRFFSLIGSTLVLVFTASWAQAGLLSFDDVSLDDGSLNSQRYGGFQWDSRWGLGNNGTRFYSGSAVSGDQFIFNTNASSNLTIRRDDPFDFLGAWFGAPTGGNPAGFVRVQGFVGSELVGTSLYLNLSSSPTWFQFDYAGVDRLVVNNIGGIYTMDNFTYRDIVSEVNEAGGFVLLAIGLLGLWAARRRIRSAV